MTENEKEESCLKRHHPQLRQTSIFESFKKLKSVPSQEVTIAESVPTLVTASTIECPGSSKERKPECESTIIQIEDDIEEVEEEELREALTSIVDGVMELSNSPPLFKDEDEENVSSAESDVTLGTEDLNRMPDCLQPLPKLRSGHDHTVLINCDVRPNEVPRPYPHASASESKWDSEHVRMPFAAENVYPVDDGNGGKRIENRWSMIKVALSRPIRNSLDLEEAIMSYNSQYIGKWDFSGLHSFFTDILDHEESHAFFTILLPAMVQLALNLKEICTQPIPLLRHSMNHTVTMSQKQAASLLANAFFCTFPRRNAMKRSSEYSSYPDINFSNLFSMSSFSAHRKEKSDGIPIHKAEKIKCLMHYFRRVTSREPKGTISFRRQHLNDFPTWKTSSTPLRNICVSSTGTIEEEGYGMLQVDFANKYLGGGVLNRGCVQEEIRFVVCPELILTRLVTEVLAETECLIVTGVERYSSYTGYSSSFRWDGNYKDKTPRDTWGRRCTQVVAIDAVKFSSPKDQYREQWILRELNKAYCGFYEPHSSPDNLPAVATGNWGCGAFRGDPQLKSLLQLMAAAAVGRDLMYFTFGSVSLCKEIYHMHKYLNEKDLVVGDIYKLLLQYHATIPLRKKSSVGLYSFVYRTIDAYNSDTDVDDPVEQNKRKRSPDSPVDILDEADLGLLHLYGPSTTTSGQSFDQTEIV